MISDFREQVKFDFRTDSLIRTVDEKPQQQGTTEMADLSSIFLYSIIHRQKEYVLFECLPERGNARKIKGSRFR